MSIIPKIKLGVLDNRSKFNLSQDTSTTSNFGLVQPTFCREFIPKSSVKLRVKSGVRLSPLQFPSFGRMSLRHTFGWVTYDSLWFAHTAYMAAQPYTFNNGTTAVPTQHPYFKFTNVKYHVLRSLRSDDTKAFFNSFTFLAGAGSLDIFKSWLLNSDFNIPLTRTVYVFVKNLGVEEIHELKRTGSSTFTDNVVTEIPNAKPSDYYHTAGGIKLEVGRSSVGNLPYYAILNTNTHFKNLYKVFVGLGYNFNIESDLELNPLKLLAYYKLWYNLFYPQRDSNFYQTNCYKLISYINQSPTQLAIANSENFGDFLWDLANLCFYKAPDYFSSAILNANQGLSVNASISSRFAINSADVGAEANAFSGYSLAKDPSVPHSQLIAQRLLRFVNKNTVLGKNIHEWFRATYGVAPEHDDIHEGCLKLGASRIPIQIDDVMNTSETAQPDNPNPFGNYLGSYAGKGIGFGSGEQFHLDTKENFGCLICLTYVVPEVGYYQGILRENIRPLSRFDYFTPEWDAMGYQQLGACELFYKHTNAVNPDTSVFGLVPRYMHYKVGRNIVNGDLSNSETADTMLGYTFDRSFDSSPANTVNFRAIGLSEDANENYNRIFRYVNSDYDHFIIHNVFDVVCVAPMKSIGNSYDTMENADHTIEVNHE